MKKQHILIVEDSIKSAELLRDYLLQAGFSVSILGRGDEVLPMVESDPPDLILLDVMLPGKDGLSVCRDLRSFSSIPVVMISAKVQEADLLSGLNVGADDYICKPFSPRIVTARVQAVLRRACRLLSGEQIVSGPITLDTVSRRVTVNGQEISLTHSEFSLLRILMGRPMRVFSRSDLIAQVQGYEHEGYIRTIDSHIKNLRKKNSRSSPGL